jgi:dephospho-CoA kinase
LTRFIGLTGGIGAGKSETLAAFERLGAATLSTDRVTHELLEDDQVRAALIERWGPAVAPGDGVDRNRVGEIVFSDPGELAFLEGVLHPRVGVHVLEWRENLGADVEVAVVEVPLLFEAAMEGAFDATVAVVAGDEIREARLRERGQPGLEEREGRQLDQAEKERRADHVIRNEGSIEELESKVSELIDQIKSETAG